jgi:two-component system sensor histidine kinase SenX3
MPVAGHSGTLANELCQHRQDIVQRWYEAWRQSSHPRPEVGEAALKDLLPQQLKVIGEQLLNLERAENTERMWKIPDRLDPEKRVGEDIPIEEVVQEYRLVVEVIRQRILEHKTDVSFDEYSYFYDAIFQLTAESVRRYERHRAEAISQSRGEYLASIMHQIRSPLAAVGMQIEALSRGPQAPGGPAVARLRRNLRRMSFLVNGVLRIERFRPEEMPVEPRPMSPWRAIEEIMTDHEYEAVARKLRFEAHVSRSLQMEIDPDLFTDVIGNFVQNAIKHTREGFVIVEAEEEPDQVIFRVRDSGPGIPEEMQRSLFKEIQPGSGGGVGIGLQIAKHAAEAQGGSVGFETEPGKGSQFWIRLPRRVPPRG